MTNGIGSGKSPFCRGEVRYPTLVRRFTSCDQIVDSKAGKLLHRFLNEEVQLTACQRIKIDDDKMKIVPELRITVSGQQPADKATIDRLTRTALNKFLAVFQNCVPEVAQDASLVMEEGRQPYILLKGYR